MMNWLRRNFLLACTRSAVTVNPPTDTEAHDGEYNTESVGKDKGNDFLFI